MSQRDRIQSYLENIFINQDIEHFESVLPGFIDIERQRVLLECEHSVYSCRGISQNGDKFILKLTRLPRKILFQELFDLNALHRYRDVQQHLELLIEEDLLLVQRLMEAAEDVMERLRQHIPISEEWGPVLYGPGLNPETVSVWIKVAPPLLRKCLPEVRYRICFYIDASHQITASVFTDNLNFFSGEQKKNMRVAQLKGPQSKCLIGLDDLRITSPVEWKETKWNIEDIDHLCRRGIQHIQQKLCGLE
jgi:hypothetical protein